MKKSVLVTGVSGAGKSTISKTLREMGYSAYDLDDVPGLFAMIDAKTKQPVVDHDNANLKKVQNIEWLCNAARLTSLIAAEKNDIAFYCGSATNLDEILPLFDTIVLLKVGHEAMQQRLTDRTENDFGKTREVRDWLLTQKDSWEDDVERKGATVIDAHQSIADVAREIIEKTKH